jgi:hypothetical protein
MRKTITTIDCTIDQDADRYFSTGDARVVDGPAGRYREAAGKPLSRFGYRFRIARVGPSHRRTRPDRGRNTAQHGKKPLRAFATSADRVSCGLRNDEIPKE